MISNIPALINGTPIFPFTTINVFKSNNPVADCCKRKPSIIPSSEGVRIKPIIIDTDDKYSRNDYWEKAVGDLEYLDNGAIVMADGYKKNEDGVDMLKVVPYDGSAGKTTYLLATAEEDQLAIFNNVAPQGYRDFFNENDEIVRVFKTRCGDLRYEITNFTLDSSISEVAVGNDVFWDGINFGYIVGGTTASGIVKVGKVVEPEGQFAAGLGLDSIVIDMDV